MYINQRTKNKALEEVQTLDSSAFYKYELVWKGATIAAGKDYIVASKATTLGGKKVADGDNGSSVIYTEERVVFNPYGPSLDYDSGPVYRREKGFGGILPNVSKKKFKLPLLK
jgi:hypothetical protein